MKQFDTFRFNSDKVAVEISKNINKVKYYETDTNINVEYVDNVRLCESGKLVDEDNDLWEYNDFYFISLDNDVSEAIAKMIATSLRCYAGGTTELVDVEHAEDDGHHYAIIWSI